MINTYMKKAPKPYKRNKTAKTYKAKYMLPNNNRKEVDLGTNSLKEAEAKAKNIFDNYYDYFKIDKLFDLYDLIHSYTEESTNPKLLESKETGKTYKPGTLRLMTRMSIYNEKLLLKKAPILMHTKVNDLSRSDVIRIRKIIHNDCGNTRKAQMAFDQIKQYISFSYKIGEIKYNSGDKIPSINYVQIKKTAIHPELLAEILLMKSIFPSIESWSYFTIAATTGMRRSEILGMTYEKISKINGQYYYLIDRQWEHFSNTYVSPKMGKTRIIPLADITLDAINTIGFKSKGRLFKNKWSWVDIIFQQLRLMLRVKYPNEDLLQKLSSHTLRHSLNTNLILNGENKDLIQKYLGWSREEEFSTQILYTHYGQRDLIPISKAIDEIYVNI